MRALGMINGFCFLFFWKQTKPAIFFRPRMHPGRGWAPGFIAVSLLDLGQVGYWNPYIAV